MVCSTSESISVHDIRAKNIHLVSLFRIMAKCRGSAPYVLKWGGGGINLSPWILRLHACMCIKSNAYSYSYI